MSKSAGRVGDGQTFLIDECAVRGVSSASCCAPGTCDAVVDCGFSVVDCDEAFVVPDLAWMDGVSRARKGRFESVSETERRFRTSLAAGL